MVLLFIGFDQRHQNFSVLLLVASGIFLARQFVQLAARWSSSQRRSEVIGVGELICSAYFHDIAIIALIKNSLLRSGIM